MFLLIDKIKEILINLRNSEPLKSNLSRYKEIKQIIELDNFWNNIAFAKLIIKEYDKLKNGCEKFLLAEKESSDIDNLFVLFKQESDPVILSEIESTIKEFLDKLINFQIELLLSNEADSNNCFLHINSGAGGVDAQDWAYMLLRMYKRWSENNDYRFEILEEVEGEESGIKSCTIQINGKMAYGWLKKETGIHRLIRISPFNANSKRHTSFASVWVSPVIENFDNNINIDEKHLRIDTYRSSGAGGQHVNKTESAVRITHIPTGIVSQCQNDRSQYRNKQKAMEMLKSRLYEIELKNREEKINQINPSKKTDIGWSHQIRSYVLHPYQLVKDLRTGMETSDIFSVLNGDLNNFLQASLLNDLKKKN